VTQKPEVVRPEYSGLVRPFSMQHGLLHPRQSSRYAAPASVHELGVYKRAQARYNNSDRVGGLICQAKV